MEWPAISALIGATAVAFSVATWAANQYLSGRKMKPRVTVRARRKGASLPVTVTVENRNNLSLTVRSIRIITPVARLGQPGVFSTGKPWPPSAPGGELVIDREVLASTREIIRLYTLDVPPDAKTIKLAVTLVDTEWWLDRFRARRVTAWIE